MMYQGPSKSPWGKVQTCDLLCPGVFLVSTASHGGTMVSNEVAAFLSPAAKRCGFKRGGYYVSYNIHCLMTFSFKIFTPFQNLSKKFFQKMVIYLGTTFLSIFRNEKRQ